MHFDIIVLTKHRYIADLDPYYIYALVLTAPVYQVSPLRDAIWNHLNLETSIRVDIPVCETIIRGTSTCD
jgi:hypothetical protein